MKTIPKAKIGRAWEQIVSASEADSRALAEKMQQEQPYLLVYWLATEENLNAEGEPGWLIELGAIIWQIVSAEGKIRSITDKELDEAEEANIKTLQKLDEGSDTDLKDAAADLLNTHNQGPLLGAVLEALMEGHEDAPELAPENVGMALVCCKTIIDCLDQ